MTDVTSDFVAVGCVFHHLALEPELPGGRRQRDGEHHRARPRCPRTATSNAPWLTVTSGAVASGSGAVGFAVAPTNSSRTGTINVAGHVFTVWQELSPCGAISFIAAPRFSAGPAPVFVERGDFNNDGHADLAVLNDIVSNVTQTSRVSVLTGTGAGGFDAPRSVNLGGTPRALALADFNNDGKLDVVAVIFGQANNVQVLLGDGAGNLGPPATFSAGGLPTSVAVGDFNGDGKADLAVANEDSHNVSILLGTGLGTFGTASHTGNSILHAARRVAVGDFNEDGKQDLACRAVHVGHAGQRSRDVRVSRATRGTLLGRSSSATSTRTATSTRRLERQLRREPVAGRRRGRLRRARHQPDRGPPAGRLISTDFNGDGHLDLAAASHNFQGTHDVNALLGNGAGSFTPGPGYSTGVAVRDIAVADFDGDGKQDIAAADAGVFSASDGQVALLKGTGAGSFIGARSFVGPFGPLGVAPEDFDGDGKTDLIVLTSFGVFLMPGTTPGEFGAPVSLAAVNPSMPDFGTQSASTRDFNRDGRPDLGLLTVEQTDTSRSRVRIYLNNGAGGLTQASETQLETFNSSRSSSTTSTATQPDFLSSSMNSSIRLTIRARRRGRRPRRAPAVFTPQLNPTCGWCRGDFTGDGKLDLAVTTGSRRLRVALFDLQLQLNLGRRRGRFLRTVGWSPTDRLRSGPDWRTTSTAMGGQTSSRAPATRNSPCSWRTRRAASTPGRRSPPAPTRRLPRAGLTSVGDGKPDLDCWPAAPAPAKTTRFPSSSATARAASTPPPLSSPGFRLPCSPPPTCTGMGGPTSL